MDRDYTPEVLQQAHDHGCCSLISPKLKLIRSKKMSTAIT